MAQATANNIPSDLRNESSNKAAFTQPADRLQCRFHSNLYDSSTDISEQTYGGNTSRDGFDDENDDSEVHFINKQKITLLRDFFVILSFPLFADQIVLQLKP